MKKRYLILAGLLVLAVAAAGCGKKKDDKAVQQKTEATATPEITPTKSADLVEMEVSEEKNIMGEKTATASKVTIINKTGSEIGNIYIRQHPSDEEEDDDEWGEDLVNGMFTLKNGDNAVYYYEKPQSGGVTFDIRITYTEEDRNECFFRNLPLASMKQITLRMDGSGEDSIPYATYMTATGAKEVSTLKDVKKRLGMETDEDDENTDDTDDTNSADPTDTPDPTQAPSDPDPTQAPSDDDDPDDDGNGGNTEPTDNTIETAKSYIGQSLSALQAAVGSSQADEYEDDPGSGTTGFHYYSNFTVTTAVDADGNEVVSGVY